MCAHARTRARRTMDMRNIPDAPRGQLLESLGLLLQERQSNKYLSKSQERYGGGEEREARARVRKAAV